MNKEEVYAFLNAKGIEYEVTEHCAVFTMDELTDVPLPYPEADAKNLFVRDDKHRNYYLITVQGKKRVDLKEFRKSQNTRSLTFASDDDLMRFLNLTPGSVTPMGLLNTDSAEVGFYLDSALLEGRGLIGIHPNDNTATIWMHTSDLIELIKAHGNPVHVISL